MVNFYDKFVYLVGTILKTKSYSLR